MAIDMVGGVPLSSLRRPTGGVQGFSRGGGGGGGAAGPMRGLQSIGGPQVQTMGASSGGMSTRQDRNQAVNNALHNQWLDNAWQPYTGAMGNTMAPVGPRPTPMSYDNNGRAIYGWGADGPIYTPTINYTEIAPGPAQMAGNRNTGVNGPPPANGPEMGGQIAPLPPIPQVPDIGPIDDTEAVRAAYGRAKDVAGQQGRAAMNALMEVQGGRGIVGSGLGVNEAGGVITNAANQLADVNREQAIQRVENERWRQGTNYQGRIGQRGQDYGGRGQELERRRYNAGNLPRGQVAY